MTTRQLNVEIPEDEVQKIKRDAIQMNVSLAAYVMKACRKFRQDKNVDQRRACFDKKDGKLSGRSIKPQ